MADEQNDHPSIDTRHILVPVANPSTAPGLIRLAARLADAEAAQVSVLYVVTESDEDNEELIDTLESIVEHEAHTGAPVELVTRTAPGAARGILDAAREQGVTLMLLGYEAPGHGKSDLGPVVEAVARTAPCDLLVFRNPSHARLNLDDLERVILPVDGSEHSRFAAQIGSFLAGRIDADVSAVHVQTDPAAARWQSYARIEASLNGLPETQGIQRQVIQATDVAAAVLDRANENDLIILGFSERRSLDRWLYGNVTQRMLAQAPCPVIVGKRAMSEDLPSLERAWRRLLARFSPKLTPFEQSEVTRVSLETSHVGINFIVLMLLASVLASFGLLLSSATVIIGAMLVAPLMQPLMSFSVGLIQGRIALMRTAALTAAAGVLMALLVAILVGAAMPVNFSTSEMLARGQPGLMDMGVALASGAVGAYATARKDIPAALAGVAIAAALVPPLCTVGLALAFSDMTLATGAGLLFLTNIVCISLAGAAIFVWLGVRPGRHLRARFGWVVSLVVLVALTIPLASAFLNVVRTERQTERTRVVLERQFENAEVVEVKLTVGTPLNVTTTVLSSDWVPSAEVLAAEEALSSELGEEVKLTVTNWRVITPQQSEPSDSGIRP